MDLSLQILPVGDTTPREIAAASQELQELLQHFPGMSRVETVPMPAPEGSKGPVATALGDLALSVAPTLVRGMLGIVRAILARQPGLTEVAIQTKDGKFSAKFDPKTVTLTELGQLAERLMRPAT